MKTKIRSAKEFRFDQVFGPDTTQGQIFEQCKIPDLIDKAIKGYHVTLFAYGQTGTGKTYTMEGTIGKKGKSKVRIII